MTQEEAIKRIKGWNLDDDDMEVLSTLIPELKENEDKKIKEEIMHLVMQPTWKTEKEFHRRQELCDWIEKQGEQKSANTPKFKVGDKIRRKAPRSFDKDMQVARIEKDYYVCNHIGKFSSEVVPFSKESNYELVEQNQDEQKCNKVKPIEGEFPYINPSDNLDGEIDNIWNRLKCNGVFTATKEGFEEVIRHFVNFVRKQSAWSEEDDRIKYAICDTLDRIDEHIMKYNRQLTHQQVKDWLKSLKERVQPQPKQELTEIEQELKKIEGNEYVDLGLPSGTLWKSANEEGYYTFDEAVEKFSSRLPSKEQWVELKKECKWEWKGNGYDIIGPNGNTIFLSADGYRYYTDVYHVGTLGYYWSSTYIYEQSACSMGFSYGKIGVCGDFRSDGNSVRLVK